MINQISEEFEEYYVKYYTQVYGYIYKKLLDKQLAEDLTMDVFCSCWAKFDKFDESRAIFQTWLYVIVNNKLKNYYRDRKDTDEIDESLICELDDFDEILEAIQIQQLREALYIAIKELNQTQQAIIVYKYFKNLNSTEISHLLQISSGNVRIQLKRALEKIKNYFNNNNIRWE